jgi:hypothetical protein
MNSNISAAELAKSVQGTNHHPINGVQDTRNAATSIYTCRAPHRIRSWYPARSKNKFKKLTLNKS